MNDNAEFPEWQHKPFLLNNEEMDDPAIVIRNFACSRTLPEHRQILWSILKAALASTKDEYTAAEEVAAWVLYVRDLEELLEAVNLTSRSWSKGDVTILATASFYSPQPLLMEKIVIAFAYIAVLFSASRAQQNEIHPLTVGDAVPRSRPGIPAKW